MSHFVPRVRVPRSLVPPVAEFSKFSVLRKRNARVLFFISHVDFSRTVGRFWILL